VQLTANGRMMGGHEINLVLESQSPDKSGTKVQMARIYSTVPVQSFSGLLP